MVGIFAASILILSPTLASAIHVAPTPFADNPDCIFLNTEFGTSWTEFKVDPPTGGPHTDGVLSVILTFPGGVPDSVDWTSNIGVGAVIVKGGPNAHVYLYPEEFFDTGLVTPPTFGISHVSFCYDEPVIGGTGLQIDKTAMLLVGAQMNAAWMIPVIVSGIGFAIVIARKF